MIVTYLHLRRYNPAYRCAAGSLVKKFHCSQAKYFYVICEGKKVSHNLRGCTARRQRSKFWPGPHCESTDGRWRSERMTRILKARCNLRGAIDRQNAFAECLIDGYERMLRSRVGRRLQSHANPPSASLSRKRNLRLFKGGLNEHR